jgi:hypothetical protein
MVTTGVQYVVAGRCIMNAIQGQPQGWPRVLRPQALCHLYVGCVARLSMPGRWAVIMFHDLPVWYVLQRHLAQ